MSLDEKLAELVMAARGSAQFRSTFGTVTALGGTDEVYVRMDSMETGVVGPLPVITGKLKVGDRALATYLPDQGVWVMWGKSVVTPPADVGLIFGCTETDLETHRISVAFRVNGVWGPLIDAHTFTDTSDEYHTGGFGGSGRFGQSAESDTSTENVTPQWIFGNAWVVTGNEIFPMSDGALVATVDDDSVSPSGPRALLRLPGSSTWSVTNLFPFSWAWGRTSDLTRVHDGDTLYGYVWGANVYSPAVYLLRIEYTSGALTVTRSADVRSLFAAFPGEHGTQVYFDADNDLLHVYTSSHLRAFRMDFTLAYSQVMEFGYLAGDGTSEFFLVSEWGGGLTVRRIVAGPSGYLSVTSELGLPSLTGLDLVVPPVFTTTLEIYAYSPGDSTYRVTLREGEDTYTPWEIAATVPGALDWELQRAVPMRTGEHIRVMWTAFRVPFDGGGDTFQISAKPS